jgi:hypothetical protein
MGRTLLAVLALLFLCLLPLIAWACATPLHIWTYSYENARCWHTCCLITRPWLEASCGEYPTPPP